MTTEDIIKRLFFQDAKGRVVTKDRIRKAQGLAARSHIEWQTVLLAMTTEQQQEVERAEVSGT